MLPLLPSLLQYQQYNHPRITPPFFSSVQMEDNNNSSNDSLKNYQQPCYTLPSADPNEWKRIETLLSDYLHQLEGLVSIGSSSSSPSLEDSLITLIQTIRKEENEQEADKRDEDEEESSPKDGPYVALRSCFQLLNGGDPEWKTSTLYYSNNLHYNHRWKVERNIGMDGTPSHLSHSICCFFVYIVCTFKGFFSHTLCSVITIALELPSLFPEGTLPLLAQGKLPHLPLLISR